MALGWKILILSVAFSITHTPLHAREFEKINFADQLDLGDSKLVLNGVGLRTKKKFGMNFKVYAGALYLVMKINSAEQIIKDPSPKYLKMVFLRSLDEDTLKEAYQESYEANCKPDCEATKNQIGEFKALMVPVKENGEITIQFDKDFVKVDVHGKQTKSAIIQSQAFRNVLLRMYLGEKPPTEDLKRGLLGL